MRAGKDGGKVRSEVVRQRENFLWSGALSRRWIPGGKKGRNKRAGVEVGSDAGTKKESALP